MDISDEFGEKMFKDVLSHYFEHFSEEIYEKIGLVSFAHMVWWVQANAPDCAWRREACLKRLIALLDKLEDLDVGC